MSTKSATSHFLDFTMIEYTYNASLLKLWIYVYCGMNFMFMLNEHMYQ